VFFEIRSSLRFNIVIAIFYFVLIAVSCTLEAVKASELVPFRFYEDFERDNIRLERWATNGAYTINYLRTTTERKYSGEKSFKIDITFDTATYVYLAIPIDVPAEYSSLKFSGQILVESPINAGLGLNTIFYQTTHSGCEPFGQFLGPCNGKWKSVSHDDCGGWAMTIAERILDEYIWQGSKEICGTYLDKIGIFLYGSPGSRAVVYVDDILLEGTVVEDSEYREVSEKRWAQYVGSIKAKVDDWEERLNITEGQLAESDQKIPDMVEEEIAHLRSELESIKNNNYIMTKENAELFITTLPLLERFNFSSSNIVDMLCFISKPISTRKVLPDTAVPGNSGDTVSISLTPGEYEPGSFILRPTRDIASLNLELSDLTDAETGKIIPASNVDIRVVKCWYQGGTAWSGLQYSPERVLVPELLLYDDSLIRVNHETKTHEFKVTEKDGSYRYLPTTVGRQHDGTNWTFTSEEFPLKDSSSLQPVELIAGENKQFWITIKVPETATAGTYTGRINLTSGAESFGFITLKVTVLPFNLPESPLTYSIYYRGQLNKSNEATISSESKSELQFRRELENMIAHGIKNPSIYQSPDDKELFGKVLEIRNDLGLAGEPLYYLGVSTYGIGATQEELEWLKNRVSDTINFARGYGVTDVFIYGQDEATGEDLIRQRRAWQTVHEVGGKMFVAGYAGKTDSVKDLLDVLICAFRPLQTEAEKWHVAGKKIFVYAYPQGGPEDPELFRRNYGLLTLMTGYDGAMTYAYQDPCPGNPWDDFEGKQYFRGHMMTYPTIDGVIDTLAIEGFREAVDDVRYATLLYQKIEEATSSDDPQRRQLAADAEEYLAELDVSGDLDKIREEIICYILKLSK